LALEYHADEIGFKMAITNFIRKQQLVNIMKSGETSAINPHDSNQLNPEPVLLLPETRDSALVADYRSK